MNAPSRDTSELAIEPPHVVASLFGPSNETIRLLAKSLDLELGVRGNVVRAAGAPEAVALVLRLLGEAADLLAGGLELAPDDVVRGLDAMRGDASVRLRDLFEDVVLVTARRRPIRAKTIAQRRYVQAIRSHDLTFGIGPAGTGKTYLAMAMAVRALLDKQVKRIVLARPAVEAGEKLGFLPGDLAEKVNPYLRPLYDALHDMMDPDKAQGLVTRGQIEVAPLAFMRGRTLNDSFIILDEAQNATSEQMRMFLTRMGYGSRSVVTGDVTQVDLPYGQRSGLAEARDLLKETEGIAFSTFTDVDVVRHPLVQSIIIAYERRDAALAARREEREARGEAEPGRERGRGPRGASPGGQGGRHPPAGAEKLPPAASNPGADTPELRDPPQNRP